MWSLLRYIVLEFWFWIVTKQVSVVPKLKPRLNSSNRSSFIFKFQHVPFKQRKILKRRPMASHCSTLQKKRKKIDSEMFLLRIISNLLVLRFLHLQLSHLRTGLSTLERLLVQIRLHLLHTISSSLLPLSASWFHGSIHQIRKQIIITTVYNIFTTARERKQWSSALWFGKQFLELRSKVGG